MLTFRKYLIAMLLLSFVATGIPVNSLLAALYPVYCTTDLAIKAGNGLYVSAELGYGGNDYGLLRARAATVGPWEKFKLCHYQTPEPFYTLQSQANNLYVSVELGWPGESNAVLRARSSSYGPWERFKPSVINNIASEANAKLVRLMYVAGYTNVLRANGTVVDRFNIFKLH